MKRKRFLYHVTEPENVGNILKFGLLFSRCGRQTCGIYLSEKPLSWYREGLDILRVDITGLECIEANTSLPELDEIIFWGEIPAWMPADGGKWKPRIELVTDKYVGRKCKPCKPTQPECGDCEYIKGGDENV